MALDYGFGVELCTPGRGQEKGSVENLVGFVKGSFFKVRRFHDHEDLVVQLGDWHHEVNEVRPCRATGNSSSASSIRADAPAGTGWPPASIRLNVAEVLRTTPMFSRMPMRFATFTCFTFSPKEPSST